MTQEEVRKLSERIATLAEQAGLPAELLWDPAETCPLGHSTRDIECGYIEYKIGDLCRECWTEAWRNPRLEMCEMDAEIDAVVDKEWAAYNQFDDPTFHPEWRIGRVAKDLTDPTSLYSLVQAWIDAEPACRYFTTKWIFEIGKWECTASEKPHYWRHGYDSHRTIAEAQAFVSALELKGGVAHD